MAKKIDVVIKAPNMQKSKFTIIGTAPLVMCAFSQKARELMRLKQEQGSQGKKGTKREGKDFQECYEQAKHISEDGWIGIPAAAFRAALISACRLVGFKMTIAKLSVFIEADGYDKVDGTPLVKITKGQPRYTEHLVRLETGVADVRPRPMWSPGWEADVTVRWDGDQFAIGDVVNLLQRAGTQVGLLEGRPDSKKSAGCGWGTFTVKGNK